MKKIIYILLLIAIAIAAITCKKTPEIPTGGNKIEIGETITDTLTYYTAKVSTIITGLKGNEIKQLGHCWSLVTQPTVENDEFISNVLDSITVSSNLTELEANKSYFVRPFVTTNKQTLYGQEVSIKTVATRKPIVTTSEVINITINTAICGGTNDDGGLTISQRGVCWNITGNPSLENNIGHTTDGNGLGNFTSNISGLNDGITYYATAYATNEKGTSYGEVKQFETVPITLPAVTTTEITEITTTSAISGGYVTSNGNSTVTVRGICWNTTGNPTLENNIDITTNSSGTGVFTSEITGLDEGTAYYVTAYATNEKGSSYGNVVSFTSLILSVPNVSTTAPTNITNNTVTSGGNVTSDGNGTVIQRGVCWNINGNPSLENNIGQIINGSGTGSFISDIYGLLEDTQYYIRAYATNEKGNAYGEIKNFKTIKLEIGDFYCGGIIFYLDGIGGGLVCADINQSINSEWGCSGVSIGGTSSVVGSGAANTAAIVAECNEPDIAARICNELVLNGYSDWFLPSKDELNLMYENLHLANHGGFNNSNYWSSSEQGILTAWLQNFTDGFQNAYYKVDGIQVRAVRSF